MKKKQGKKTARKHRTLITIGSGLALSVAIGFIYCQAVTHVASLMLFERQSLQIPPHVRLIPLPSAILLFSMGLLGVLCVRLAEKKKTSSHAHTRKLGKPFMKFPFVKPSSS